MTKYTNYKKILSSLLTLCVLLSILTVGMATAQTTLDVSYLMLAPGADETQLTFSWHTQAQVSDPVVRIYKQGDEAMVFHGESSTSTVFTDMHQNKVTVTDLTADTTYTYQLGDGEDNWSIEYTTKTGNPASFSYLVYGDPQVSSQTYGDGWKNTLDLALSVNPDLAFMASTGDNIDAVTLAQYNYFFTPQTTFSSLPNAVCFGNHEGSSANNDVFYNPPNAANAHSDYWYIDTVTPYSWYGMLTMEIPLQWKPLFKPQLRQILMQHGEFSTSTTTYMVKVTHTPFQMAKITEISMFQ